MSAQQLRNEELSQAGIQISSEEQLQLHGGNPGHTTGAKRETTRAKCCPRREKTRSLTATARGLGSVQSPLFVQNSYGRAICLAASSPAPAPASRWILTAACEWREPVSQRPKAKNEGGVKRAGLSLAEGAGTVRQDFQVPPPQINTSCENKLPYLQAPALRTPGSKMGFLTQSTQGICPFHASLKPWRCVASPLPHDCLFK